MEILPGKSYMFQLSYAIRTQFLLVYKNFLCVLINSCYIFSTVYFLYSTPFHIGYFYTTGKNMFLERNLCEGFQYQRLLLR